MLLYQSRFGESRGLTVGCVLWVFLLGACTAPTPMDHDPKVIDGLTTSKEMILQLYDKVESNRSTAQYTHVKDIYSKTVNKLKAVRYRATSRPERTSFFESILNYAGIIENETNRPVKNSKGGATSINGDEESSHICAPPAAEDLTTTKGYSIRSLDNAIQTIEKMQECHKNEDMKEVRLKTFKSVIDTYMSNAIFIEQALKVD